MEQGAQKKLEMLLSDLLKSKSYSQQGISSLNSKNKILIELLSCRKMFEKGLDKMTIQYMLYELSLMESNNQEGKVGVGEREGRVFSDIVKDRHWGLSHGMGRSGDIMSVQPKAVGSSVIVLLTTYLVSHALSLMHYKYSPSSICLLPLSTGMALMLVLQHLKTLNPLGKYVIMSRIDQKTCVKCIQAANLTPIVIDNLQQGDSIHLDIQAMKHQIHSIPNKQHILGLMSVSSCFAPRQCNSLVDIGELAKQEDIPHVVNNAYGLQCSYIAWHVQQMQQHPSKYRLDYIVQSMDKNFLVPVGGAIVLGAPSNIAQLNSLYPG